MSESLESAEGTERAVPRRPVTRRHPSSPTFRQATATIGRARLSAVVPCPRCDEPIIGGRTGGGKGDVCCG